MQQPNNSSCKIFTIAYATNIVVGLNLEQSIYNVPQMRLHLQNNIKNKSYLHSPNTCIKWSIVIKNA